MVQSGASGLSGRWKLALSCAVVVGVGVAGGVALAGADDPLQSDDLHQSEGGLTSAGLVRDDQLRDAFDATVQCISDGGAAVEFADIEISNGVATTSLRLTGIDALPEIEDVCIERHYIPLASAYGQQNAPKEVEQARQDAELRECLVAAGVDLGSDINDADFVSAAWEQDFERWSECRSELADR